MNDDEFRQAMATLESYRVQLEAMTKQSKYFQYTFEEVSKAGSTIKAVSEAKEGDEVLIPVGALSFIKAKITGEKTVIVGIGNKVSIDMPIMDAVNYMAESTKEMTDAIQQLNEAINDMNAKARELSLAIQQEYQRRKQ